MSSNLYNKALKNVKFKNNSEKVKYSESEMSDHLKSSFYLEFNDILKAIELKKLNRVILFEFLSKYDGNVPESFFYKNVLRLGEKLMRYKYWASASNECYERYLVSVVGVTVEDLYQNIDITVKKCLESDEVRKELTVCALFGVCRAQLGNMGSIDPQFESPRNRGRCQSLLKVYQMVTEAIIAKEASCWLIYNGTVHIYEICHRLIHCQRSNMAVEPLIWASCCLETSIPLLTIANLKWRSTLYSAACQALYNCGQDSEAERFARRGLAKINELNTLYEMSSESLTVENALIITEATIKMAAMIFKRAVFEIRRRPKTYLRPKTKVNFKELLQGNWPRTGTERFLDEMFESPSQQALAIVEAIKQPLRPLGKVELPTAENDWDILDVYSELFYAFSAIVTGRSSTLLKGGKGFVPEFRVANLSKDEDQLSLAVRSGTEVTVGAVYDMVCWAFTYSNWEFLDVTLEPLLSFLNTSGEDVENAVMIHTLQLLTLMRRVIHSSKLDRKTVKVVEPTNEEDRLKEGEEQDPSRINLGSVSSMSKDTKSSKSKRENSAEVVDDKQKADPKGTQDPLYQLAEYVNTLISDPDINITHFSKEILIEAGCIFWSKCKSIFHSVQDGSIANKVMRTITSPGKWISILSITNRLFTLTNYAQLNPVTFAELSIRLATLLEEMSLESEFKNEKDGTDTESDGPSVQEFMKSLDCVADSRSEKCLLTAKRMLQTSIQQMDKGRSRHSMNKGDPPSDTEEVINRDNTMDDIYLELNSLFFRVSIRGILMQSWAKKEDGLTLLEMEKNEAYKECLKFCNKNCILKAMLHASVANLTKGLLPSKDAQVLATMARAMLEKATENISVVKSFKTAAKLPPPVVVERGSGFISVKLDEEHISQELREQIGWIRLYGRAVDSPNAEVRLTDDKLSGTGLETCSTRSLFVVRDLVANEQYIFAFAAFDKSGSMIGRGMGLSTKKILATDSISRITVSALIAQMLYEVGFMEEVIRYEEDLWTHFMEPLPDASTVYTQSSKPRQYLHNNYKLKGEFLATSSAMLLRQYCILVLSAVDCKMKLNSITTEPPKTAGSHVKEQMLRIDLCDRLLAMFAISKKLKNHVLTMELFASVVQLTVPIMNHNQYYLPFIEILMLAITTMHSLPQTTWIKIPAPFKIHIHHMIASVGFYLLKYYHKYDPSNESLESIRNWTSILLSMSSEVPFTISEQEDELNNSNGASRQEHAKTQKQTVSTKKSQGKSYKSEGSIIATLSSQQIAFEAYKYSMVLLGSGEPSLTGSDEPDILLAYIANLPSKVAYKEVIKFARKTRYLQFVVEVAHKAMVEGNLDQSIAIYKDIREWLRRRNESILGRGVLPPPSQMNVDVKKSDHMDGSSVKESEDDDTDLTKKQTKAKKKTKYKAITVTSAMNEAQRQKQEEAEIKALSVLASTFPNFQKQCVRRRRFRQVSEYETSSRIRLNSAIAMSFMGIAQSKMDSLIQLLSAGYQLSEISEMEDVTKYMLNNTGQLLPLNVLRSPRRNSGLLKITAKPRKDPLNDRPRTFRPDAKVQDKRLIAEAPKVLSQYRENVSKACVLLKKAIVLSERRQNSLLLSRSCSLAWHCLTTTINVSVKFENFVSMARNDYPEIDWTSIQSLNTHDVYSMFIGPFYLGSDALLDVMERSQVQSETAHFDQDFMENYILRTLHLLFETRRYESCVHIVLRFTKLTKYNFVNVTHPLMIKCQDGLVRMSKEREHQDPSWRADSSRRHIADAMAEMQWIHIDSNNYDRFLTRRQLGQVGRIRHSKNQLNTIHNLDKEQPHVKNLMSILTPKNVAALLFSVPVDSAVSRAELEEASSKPNEERLWNDLCRKRQLYIYHQNIRQNQDPSLTSLNDITQTYKDGIDYFKRGLSKEYCALSQRDLGDLLSGHSNKMSQTLSLWTESLEHLLNTPAPLDYLERLLTNESGSVAESICDTEILVTKFGILRCLEIGGVLARIVRVGDFPHDRRRMLCIFAACFYKSVYGTSLAHPSCDLEYLEQYLSLDSVNPAPLLVNVHLCSNQSRNDIQDVESQLWFLINELFQDGHHLFTLPLMAFYEHIACTYLRSPLKCTQIRILKLEAAIHLRQFGVASRILFQLLAGERCPQPLDSQMSPAMSKSPSVAYDDTKSILNDNNMVVLDNIMSRRLNGNIAQRIGLQQANMISILQAQLLLDIAANINAPIKTLEPRVETQSERQTISKKSTIKKTEAPPGQSEDMESVLEQVSSKMKWDSYKQITLPQLKGVLLHVAGGLVRPLTDDLLMGIQKESVHIWHLKSADAQTVIPALLLQAKICRQQNYNRSGARLAMFACRVLDEMEDDTELRHGRCLDVRRHIQCIQEMVECLLGEVGIGQTLALSDTYIADVPDLKTSIVSAISECDDHCLYQEKAWFIGALARFALFSGFEVEKYLPIVQEALEVTASDRMLTEECRYLHNECRSELVNLQLTMNTSETECAQKSIVAIHQDILESLDKKYPKSVFWNDTDSSLSHTTVANIYDGLYDQLSRAKLLLAIAALNTITVSSDLSRARLRVVTILNCGLEIVRIISMRKPWVEVEFLMMIGRLQRYLMTARLVSSTTAVSTLVEGLKLSISSSGHLGVQKQFFLELALTFTASSRMCAKSFNEYGEITSSVDISSTTKSLAKSMPNEAIVDELQNRRLCWLAMKCASHISSCVRHISHVKSDSSRLLSTENKKRLPLSISFDLFGRFLLGEKRIIFKNEIEEELSRMPESRVARESEHVEDQLDRIKQSSHTLTWSQVFSYQEMVTRATNNKIDSAGKRHDFRVADVARRTNTSAAMFLKEFEVHKFLKAELSDYSASCVPFVPKEILQFSSLSTMEGVEDEEVRQINGEAVRGPKEGRVTGTALQLAHEYGADMLDMVQLAETHSLERVGVTELDLVVQIVSPPLEQSMQLRDCFLLMYACCRKTPKNASKLDALVTGWRVVPAVQLLRVHDDLQQSAHVLEVVPIEPDGSQPQRPLEGSKKATPSTGGKPPKVPSQQTVFAPGSEISEVEWKVRSSLDTVCSWGGGPSSTCFLPPQDAMAKGSPHGRSVGEIAVTVSAIPFELTADNVRSLAHLFDPFHTRPLANSPLIAKFMMDSLKIDFLQL